MTSLQTCCFLPINALILLFLLLFAPTLAEVVKSISACNQFLLEETPPRVPGILESGEILNQNQYKPICQSYKNKRRFLTLYDIKNKIPVFSAYKYIGEMERKRPKKYWKIEPQLENENDSKNMRGKDKEKIYKHQAVDTDFRSNGTFDRGHIFPSSHAFTNNDKLATFTLTNIVPQAGTFNKGSWNKMERCIKCVMDKYCINSSRVTEGYVVTGAQPSSNNILNNIINIPSMLWSAFCCYSSNMEIWIASAHWGDNVPDESKDKYLQTKTLSELHKKLTTDSEFNVFPGTQCPLNTTVTEFYPKIKDCFCPPSISTSSASSSSTSAAPSLTSIAHNSPSAASAIASSTSGTPTPASGLIKSTSGTPISTSALATSTSGSHTSTFGIIKSTSGTLTSASATASSTPDSHISTFGIIKSTSGTPNSASGSTTFHLALTLQYLVLPNLLF